MWRRTPPESAILGQRDNAVSRARAIFARHIQTGSLPGNEYRCELGENVVGLAGDAKAPLERAAHVGAAHAAAAERIESDRL